MSLIRGGLLFLVSFLLMSSLMGGNLFLTLALSLEDNDFRSEILSGFADISGEDLNLTREVEDNFYLLEEHCENNTNFVFDQGGFRIDIPCEVVDQGPEAVIDEGVNDIAESAIKEAYPDSSLAGSLPVLFLSSNSSDYWRTYFYISLVVSFILIALMFLLKEKKAGIFISVGFLVLISSLPFIIIDFLLPMLENSILRPVSLLFSGAYTVFLVGSILGTTIIILGFGLKFFKIGWSLSEKFGKIKNLFSRKSKINTPQEDKS